MAQGSDQNKQDQRVNSVMEDTNAMTIEFLRARLLAERAVSKSTRERADELAKRVTELEEQLNTVSLQRKKAEKATVDILAILEENGMTDISEFDSSSEHENFSDNHTGESFIEVEEISVDSKVSNKETESLSASEHDSFPAKGRSLSWKGRKSEPTSSEKFKESLMRRRISSKSMYFSSPKPREGKSCRKIKHRESRPVTEGHKQDRNMVVFQEIGVEDSSDVLSRTIEETPEPVMESSEILGEQELQKGSISNGSENETNADMNMERAIEHQVQLIGRFEDMERAQREWEEKFREINRATPDSCDPGNHSDVTEENDETKTQAQHKGVSLVEEARYAAEGVRFPEESCKIQSHDLLVHSEASERNESRVCVSESVDLGFGTGKDNQENVEKEHFHPQSTNRHFYGHSFQQNESTLISASNSETSSCKEVSSGVQKGAYALVPHEPSDGCSSVLQALKQARLSLQQKVCNSPATEAFKSSFAPARRTNSYAIPAESVLTRKDTEIRCMVEIPVGCAGLFRLPTDFSAEASESNFLVSGSQLSPVHPFSDTGITLSSRDRLLFTEVSNSTHLSSTFQRSLPNNVPAIRNPHTDDRLSTTPHVFGSLLMSGFPTDDPLISGAQVFRPYTGKQTISNSLLASACAGNGSAPESFYSNTGLHHSKDGFSTSYPSGSAGLPPSDRLSYYDNNFRPNHYK